MAEHALKKLTSFINATHQDANKLQKTVPICHQQKTIIKDMASKARTAVASEIVELCNALIRRGNDIVNAIDMAEDSKLKILTKFENDAKFAHEKFRKV